MALEPSLVRRICFDLDAAALRRRKEELQVWYDDRPVYICGMARSGTTLLLRILSEVPELRSLRYSDMPFVLSPSMWKRVGGSHRRAILASERAHGDGILVDHESPEAFEEVFWRTFAGVSVEGDRLCAPQFTADAQRRFETYRRIVVASSEGAGAGRYLSKNNNNLLRLDTLVSSDRATALVCFRDPFDTARSSHSQHLRFSRTQREDAFVRRYMRWLVHHEFGLDHRPLGIIDPSRLPESGPVSPDYWLAYWILVHRYLLEVNQVPVVFVDHDRLRAEPLIVLGALLDRLRIRRDVGALSASVRGQAERSSNGFSSLLAAEAIEVHAALRADARNLQETTT